MNWLLELGVLLFVAAIGFLVGNYVAFSKMKSRYDAVYPAIEHGDAQHRLWLKLALDAIYNDKPPPKLEDVTK